MNDYEKELYEEFGQGNSPLHGLSIYFKKCLHDAAVAIDVLCEAYQEDLWETSIEERTDENMDKKQEAFFYMIDCIKQRICYKFNQAQSGYDSFCDYEDKKIGRCPKVETAAVDYDQEEQP